MSVEVTNGGKCRYHMWIFHNEHVLVKRANMAFVRLGRELFNFALENVPFSDNRMLDELVKRTLELNDDSRH